MASIVNSFTPKYIIFHKSYLVRVKNIDTLDKEYIQQRGLPYTGDHVLDSTFANEIIDKYVTIAQMAEWFSQGITIRIKNESDMIEIYQVIYKHLQSFQQALDSSYNISSVPVEDLKKLSNFASTIFPHIGNTDFIKEETKLPEFYSSYSAIDMSKIFRPIPKSQEKKQEQERINNHYNNVPVELETAPHEDILKEIEEKTLYRRQEWRPR